MPITRSGKHYTIRAKRFCKRCRALTDQHTIGLRYRTPPEPTVPPTFIKWMEWICEPCDNIEVEEKTVYEPTDKTKLINRFLHLNEDYDIHYMDIQSLPNEIVLRIKLPNCDMSEIRAIQQKQMETGAITVYELMRLQEAGFRRPRDVPVKPMPRDRSRLRERARQRMFYGERLQ